MRRLGLQRLARRLLLLLLRPPGGVRARVGSGSDFGGSSVVQKYSAVRAGSRPIRMTNCIIVQAPQLATFVVAGRAGTH